MIYTLVPGFLVPLQTGENFENHKFCFAIFWVLSVEKENERMLTNISIFQTLSVALLFQFVLLTFCPSLHCFFMSFQFYGLISLQPVSFLFFLSIQIHLPVKLQPYKISMQTPPLAT